MYYVYWLSILLSALKIVACVFLKQLFVFHECAGGEGGGTKITNIWSGLTFENCRIDRAWRGSIWREISCSKDPANLTETTKIMKSTRPFPSGYAIVFIGSRTYMAMERAKTFYFIGLFKIVYISPCSRLLALRLSDVLWILK